MHNLAGLKVLLVNMPIRESALPNCAPLGPALLAAILRDHGASVSIVDLNAYRISPLGQESGSMRHLSHDEAEKIISANLETNGVPHMIGLSGMITTLKWQSAIAPMLRRLATDSFIISGGGLASQFGEGLINWIGDLDAVCRGEGDSAILQIGADVLHGKTYTRAYIGERPADLDALPFPAWDLLHKDALGAEVLETYIKNPIWGLDAKNSTTAPFTSARSMNMIASRGCPHHCRFCYKGTQGDRKYGFRSVDSIFNEFNELHKRYKLDFIGILDDNCLVRTDRLQSMVGPVGDFCRSSGIRWGTHGRMDEAADIRPSRNGGFVQGKKRVEDLASAGCVYVGFGAESASPKVLESMNKGGMTLSNGTVEINGRHVPRTMVEGYKNTVNAGIHGNCTWITGFPGEAISDLKDSVGFIKWQQELVGSVDSVNQKMFVATAFPGTEMFSMPGVRKVLTAGFNIKYDSEGKPICDDALRAYVEQLDDATKVLTDNHGNPVYYGAMSIKEFMKSRELLDAGDLDGIMRL